MRRTLFYDRETGQLLHSHYEVRAVEGDDAAGARLSAPKAVELDAEMAELVSRGLDPERLGSLTTSVAPQSSRRTERSVNVKTGRLRSRRLELVAGGPDEED
jgi:inactivated superfamily I helicase